MIYRISNFLRFFVLAFLSVLITSAYGQETQEDDGFLDLSTPYGAVVTHLSNLQPDSYYPEKAANAFNAPELSLDERIQLAVRLKQIFDGKGEFIIEDDLPKSANYTDTTRNNENRYTPVASLPKVYLLKTDGKWQYSPYTAANIEEIFEEVYPLGSSQLLDAIGELRQDWTNSTFMGLKVWQWIGFFLLVFFSLLAHALLTFIFKKVIMGFLIKFKYGKVANNVVLPVARPFSLLVVFSFLQLFFPVLQFPVGVNYYFITVLQIMVPFFIIVVLYRMVDVISYYMSEFAAKTENTLDDQLVPIVRKSLKVVVVIGGGLFILQNLDFNITGLLAGLSIGGLAFALAAQDTIKNLFGSLMIFIDRPFQMGDWIVTSGVNGTVEEVGFRSTRIRTFHNSLVYIPNGKIADMTVDNMGLRSYRRFNTKISITYDTPAHKIEAFVEGLKKIVASHVDTRKDFYEVHLNEFGDFSLSIMFYIFFIVPTWSEELRCRHEVMLEIIKLAERLEVRFAFPTQTVHIEDFPGQESLTPIHAKSKQELLAQIEASKLQGKLSN